MKKKPEVRNAQQREIPPRWAGLLLCSSLVFFCARAFAIEVSAEDGLLTVVANDEPLQAVVAALADTGELRLHQLAVFDRHVTIEARRQPVEEILDQLLGAGDSYQLFLPGEGSSGVTLPATLWVFETGKGDEVISAFYEAALLRGGVADRKAAIRALQALGTDDAVRALSQALTDPDERVRRSASEALAAQGGDEALAALASGMSSANEGDRIEATLALAEAGGRSAGAYVDLALADDDPRIRAAAVHALEDLHESDARQRLKSAIQDRDPDVRERALGVLDALDDEALFRTLYPGK